MSNKPRIDQYPRNGNLTIADGQIYEIRRGGDFIRIKTASADLKLRIDNDQELTLSQNDVLRFQNAPFKGLEVVNNSGGNLTFQVEVGEGGVETNNVSISGDLNIALAGGRTHTTATVGTDAIEILAANAARKGWKVVNNGTVPIYLGSDDTVTVANGDPLAAGAATGWDDKDAIYAISGSAGQDVRITEIE